MAELSLAAMSRGPVNRFHGAIVRSRAVSAIDTPTVAIAVRYIVLRYMRFRPSINELKKGSAELLILSLVETRARHGYEISKMIETRSAGDLRFNAASLYPLLYRLEQRRWIEGRWVEKSGQRRRRYYRITSQGRKVLAAQRDLWRTFVAAVNRVTGAEHA
jgi:transcriptional regulator